MDGAFRYLKRQGLPCSWAVLGDDLLDLPEAEAREWVRQFTSRLTREQKREDVPQSWVRVWETSGGVHANMIFPATPVVVSRLHCAYEDFLKGDKAIQPVTDFRGLVVTYLSKERAPQAKHALGGVDLGPRLKGSHRLGQGGGDRVQLSRGLADAAIRAGLVEPWKRTTSKNLARKSLAPAEIKRPQATAPIRLVVNNTAVGEAMQLGLFQHLPPAPYLNPDRARRYREANGITQQQFGERLGIRNRSHVANWERNHDRLSMPRLRLVRHMIENEGVAA